MDKSYEILGPQSRDADMTKTQKIQMINEVIQGPRGEFARQMGAEAYLMDGQNVRYRDRAKGYARRISFSELLSYLHGEDIRSLRGAL